MVTNEALGSEPVPFGFMHEEWADLVEQIREGDELWQFTASGESWANLGGEPDTSSFGVGWC